MRKALLISYRFPPQGGGGVQRTLKYTKYLREFGWEPVVHTALNPFWPVWDASLLRDIPNDVRVYKTRAFEFERFESRLQGWFGSRAQNGATASPKIAAAAATSPANARPKPRGGSRLGAVRELVHKHLLIPDPQVAWVPGALLDGLRIVRRERVTLIHSSSPPNSVHLFAGLLARRARLPWVADFRDPWTDGPRRRRNYENNRLRERVEKAAERWVVRNADRVVVSAPSLRDRFLKKYPFLEPGRVVVLTNGFDPEDFAMEDVAEPLLEPGRFHIVGTGNIETMFDRRPLYQAIAGLIREGGDIGRDLHVTLVGAKEGPNQGELRALGLEERVRYPGWVPHARSVRYLHEADALIMCQLPHAGGGGEKLSGKCFEYLNMRKPIICLTVPGQNADLLRESGLGHNVDPFDTERIAQVVRELYAKRGEKPHAVEEVISRFNRRTLTERLAAIFDELAGSSASAIAASPSPGAELR
jgi:glycosyltransferase involved in cell wall biosynthesis